MREDGAMTIPLRERPSFRGLQEHFHELEDVHLRELFARDPDRGERLTTEGAGLFLDYSKHRVTTESLMLLRRLAAESGLAERIEAMFTGQRVNETEERAALHTALRAPREVVIEVDGVDIVPEVHAMLQRMSVFADRVRGGGWTGHTGRRIRSIVNIGI